MPRGGHVQAHDVGDRVVQHDGHALEADDAAEHLDQITEEALQIATRGGRTPDREQRAGPIRGDRRARAALVTGLPPGRASLGHATDLDRPAGRVHRESLPGPPRHALPSTTTHDTAPGPPTLCARPGRGFFTWRAPASPRSCVTTS